MSFNVTQTISSPQISSRTLTTTASPSNFNQPSEHERECWIVCRSRFKCVILLSVPVNFFMLMVYSLVMNVSLLNPLNWVREFFTFPVLLLMLAVVIHGYFTLKDLLQEKIFYATRISKFIKRFHQDSIMLTLNILLGIFTAVMFIRYLGDNFKTFTLLEEKKKFLNEKFTFLILNGAFIRCYFYFKQRDDSLNFPMVYQSRALELKRQIITVLKASFYNSLLPTCHFLGFYTIFGSFYCHTLQKIPFMGIEDTTIIGVIATVFNPRLVIYSWILSSLIWSNMEIMSRIVHLYATAPKQFPIGGSSFTLADALTMSKFRIAQQLAAQDLYLLADNPSNVRRKQFYELSVPGGHPHNWKHLVQKTVEIIDLFTNELKMTVESISKIQSTSNSEIENAYKATYQFFEGKRLAREFNNFNGIRSLASNAPLHMQPMSTEKQPSSIIDDVKKRLLQNKFVFFFLGTNEYAKLNFLMVQNAQTISWITQGISGIIVRSIQEDSYGVVQHDIKLITKSFIKLKNMLDKCGTVSSVAKDRHFLAMKSAVRRSLYRVVEKFSRFFDDLLMDPEDVRALHAFVTYKEL